MAQEECPHCGEPIEEDADFCRHCGSDAETGWKPDVDYYSVELPEEEDEPPPEPTREEITARLRDLLGPALLTAAWLFFLIYGLSRFEPRALVLVPGVYLALALVLLLRVARHPRTR